MIKVLIDDQSSYIVNIAYQYGIFTVVFWVKKDLPHKEIVSVEKMS